MESVGLLHWSAGFKLLRVTAWSTNSQKDSQHSFLGRSFGGSTRQSEKPTSGFHGQSSRSGIAWTFVKRGSPKLIMLLKKFGAHGDFHLGYLQNPTYRCGLIKEIRLLEGLSVACASLLPWRGPSLYFPMRVWLAAVRSPRPLTSCTPFI